MSRQAHDHRQDASRVAAKIDHDAHAVPETIDRAIQVVSDWRHPDVEADDADRPAPVLDAASFDPREERRQVSELDHRAALRLPHDRADGGGVRAVAEFDLLGDADATAHQARAQCPHAERGPRRDVFASRRQHLAHVARADTRQNPSGLDASLRRGTIRLHSRHDEAIVNRHDVESQRPGIRGRKRRVAEVGRRRGRQQREMGLADPIEHLADQDAHVVVRLRRLRAGSKLGAQSVPVDPCGTLGDEVGAQDLQGGVEFFKRRRNGCRRCAAGRDGGAGLGADR